MLPPSKMDIPSNNSRYRVLQSGGVMQFRKHKASNSYLTLC
jgi:hypothetical protein